MANEASAQPVRPTAEQLRRMRTKLDSGELYDPGDPELMAYQTSVVERFSEYNRTPDTPEGLKRRDEILHECLAECGQNSVITPPVKADFGLIGLHLGEGVYLNFGCGFVDDGSIYIGSHTMVGPNCTFATAAHPIAPSLRRHGLQYNKPIRIGQNVWLGSNVTVLPGVTIGDNSVIGAGAVVTHNIPANVIAVGVPAKVMREITDDDERHFDGGRAIPESLRQA